MNLGDLPRGVFDRIWVLLIAAACALMPSAAMAQADDTVPAQTTEAVETVGEDAAAASSGYTHLGPESIKGQPTAGSIDLQKQYSVIGQQASGLHVWLVWIMAIISLFVLGLLLWVIVKYNRRSNPEPSRTTHNTLIEVLWTLVPVLILVGIAIPSISLLAAQYESAPEDAVTVKVTGYQWNWGYEFPDQGVSEFISNMMPEDEARAAGLPGQLAVDNRVVVPVNTPLNIQVTSADVIHSWAVPSLWFKIDAVPGRLNAKLLTITEPGIYYGQCSELCGVKHAYMPIAVEAVPRAQWEAWIVSRGGSMSQQTAEEPREDNAATPIDESTVDGTENDGEAAPAAAATATAE